MELYPGSFGEEQEVLQDDELYSDKKEGELEISALGLVVGVQFKHHPPVCVS